mmetsp:Transcript_26663/g.38985  ORF Transcript_26663/g.38985 Transcript_26663/m.38985 type:complete len:363 (+) Transcript_26663:42-1130(+)
MNAFIFLNRMCIVVVSTFSSEAATYAAPLAPKLPPVKKCIGKRIHTNTHTSSKQTSSQNDNRCCDSFSSSWHTTQKRVHSLLHKLLLGQKVGMFLIRNRRQGILLPQFRCQITVGILQCMKNGTNVVPHRTGMTTRTRVTIINTSHIQQLLSSRRCNKTCTTWCRNQTTTDTTTLARDLTGDRMRHTSRTSPISTTDGRHVELRTCNGTTNGRGNFGGTLDTESNMTSRITDGNKGLETSTLTSRGLLLDRHNLHDFVLQLFLQKVINNFCLLDWERIQKDFFNRRNLAFLDQPSQFGNGDPNIFIGTTTSTTATTAAASSTTTTASTASKAAATSSITATASRGRTSLFTFTRHDNISKDF